MERYVDFVRIGEGSFGSVHRATDSTTGETVAVKVFHNAGDEVSRSAMREARMLAECCHCNITALKEAYQSSSGRVYLVLEYAQHVLSQQLKSHRKGLPPVAVRSIIFQLLQALQYLHSKNIMHRDCKPANILITSDGMVKLCDFGFARYARGGVPAESVDDPLTSYVITRWYRPPEVLAAQQYSTAVDIWAVGCIFAEMLTGHPLFPGASALDQMYIEHIGLGGLTDDQQDAMRANEAYTTIREEFYARVPTPENPRETVFDRLAPCMSRSMMQFLKACLCPDPEQRATASQLLEMDFIKEGAWEAPAPTAGPADPSNTSETGTACSTGRVSDTASQSDPPRRPSPPRRRQAADVVVTPPQQAAGHQPGRASKRTSNSRKMGPTVKQRRADVVAKMMESEEDDEVIVNRLQRQLPPGEPLSDSSSDDEQALAPSAAAAHTNIPTSTQQGPQQSEATQHVTLVPQPPAQPKQPASERTSRQDHPAQAGFLRNAHLHTSFAPAAAKAAVDPSQPPVSASINTAISAIAIPDPDAVQERTSAPSTRENPTGVIRHDAEPQRSSLSTPLPVILSAGTPFMAEDAQALQTTASVSSAGDRPSRHSDPAQVDTHTSSADHYPVSADHHSRLAQTTMVKSAAKGPPATDKRHLRHSVDLPLPMSGQTIDTSGPVPTTAPGPPSGPHLPARRPVSKVGLALSMSGLLLPSKSSMASAKPIDSLDSRPSTLASTVEETSGEDMAAEVIGSAKPRRSRKASLKPNPVQMTAAAITQASTHLTGAATAWAVGSRSMGRQRTLEPECPPPPGGTNPSKAALKPHPAAHVTAAHNPSSCSEREPDSDDNSQRLSDPSSTTAPLTQRGSVRVKGTLHVTGKLSRLMAAPGSLVQHDSVPIAHDLEQDSLSQLRAKSHGAMVAPRMSMQATESQTGKSGTMAPTNSVSLAQRDSIKSSGRMLSPMATRMSNSKRHGPSALGHAALSTQLSDSGSERGATAAENSVE